MVPFQNFHLRRISRYWEREPITMERKGEEEKREWTMLKDWFFSVEKSAEDPLLSKANIVLVLSAHTCSTKISLFWRYSSKELSVHRRQPYPILYTSLTQIWRLTWNENSIKPSLSSPLFLPLRVPTALWHGGNTSVYLFFLLRVSLESRDAVILFHGLQFCTVLAIFE